MSHSPSGPAAVRMPPSYDAVPSDLRQIRLLAEYIPQLVWTCLPDGYCDYLNRRWVEYTGTPEREHHGYGWVAALHPDDRGRTKALWDAFMAGTAEYDLEYRLRRHDGAYRWFKARGLMLLDAGGAVARVFGTTTDIDDQKRAEDALRESEAQSRRILESVTDAFFAIDADWRFTYVNRQAERLLGREPGDLLGQSLWEAYPGLAGTAFERAYRRAVAEQVTEEFTAYYPDHGRWYEVHVFPAAVGITVYFRDVTERERAEREIVRLAEDRRLALDAAELGSWHIDPATGELTTDQRLRAIFGVAADRLDYETAVGLIHPDDQERVRAGVLAACDPADPRPYSDDHRVVRPDGSVRWVHAVGRANFIGDGAARRLASFDGTIADVTEHKATEERLRQSEERAAFVRRAAGVGFWYCDLPFDVLEWDELVKEHFYLPPDARVTIDTFYDRIHPDDRGPTRAAIEQSIAARTTYDVDYRTVCPESGAVRWVRAIGRTAYAADGTPRRFDGVTLDVTGRKRAEESLRANEDRYRRAAAEAGAAARANAKFRAFFEQGTQFAGVLTLDGTVVEANRLCLDACGFARDEVLGRPFWECGWWSPSKELVETVRAAVRRAADGEQFRAESKYFVAGGAERVVDLTLAPVTDDSGTVLFVAASGTDVTDRKQAEESLKDADRRKDEFLALLAHELRNPLAPLRNGLQVMRLAAASAETVAKAREMMDRQLTHLVRLVDDLLDVSRISRGKMELRRGRICLRDAVAAAVETARPAIDAAGHQLTVTLPAEPVHLDADLTRLAQVFANLLTNSAKYTERGGKVWLSARAGGDAVVVTVRDTGLGIPAESLSTIFDMFSQVDRSVERAAGGLGIGLALVKGLVEMHGGTVAAESGGEGRGSTFTVRLPTLPDAPQPARPGGGEAAAHGPSRRVLVADDNRDSATSLATLLELLGHEVVTVHDGEDAVAAAESFRPEVILMDVGMPRLNGYDATRRIRGLPCGERATVVALTGWGQDADRHRSKEAGCDGHLVKPVELADLQHFLMRAGGG